MASKQVELILTGIDAWNRDDVDGWLAVLHRDGEWHTSGAFPGLDPLYRGHQRLAEFWRDFREPWRSFRIDVERVLERDDRVAAALRFRAEGKGSGVAVDLPRGTAASFEQGLVRVLVTRDSLEAALDALLSLTAPTR